MNSFLERIRSGIARLFYTPNQFATTQKKVLELESQMNRWNAALSKKADDYQNALSKKADDYQNALGSRFDDLGAKLDENAAAIGDIKSRVDGNAAMIDDIRSRVDALQTRLDSHENQTERRINQLLELAGPWISEEPDLSNDPEFLLIAYLYNFLPTRSAVDVGANEGRLTELMLNTGYHVYAFEPFPPVAEKLRARLGANPELELFEIALGSSDTRLPLYIAAETAESKVGDETLYNTFAPHFVREGLEFKSTIEVPVRTIASLIRDRQLPEELGLLKIDAEGFDLEVIRGLGAVRPTVVQTEFWGEDFVFVRKTEQKTGVSGQEIIQEMRSRSYWWNLVIFRIEGESPIRFAGNLLNPPRRAWGNIFFFRDFDTFNSAFRWCRATLPRIQMFAPRKTPDSDSANESRGTGG